MSAIIFLSVNIVPVFQSHLWRGFCTASYIHLYNKTVKLGTHNTVSMYRLDPGGACIDKYTLSSSLC